MKKSLPDHTPELWPFALACYARPGVEEICLSLQDRHATDVCLLLCGLWLEQRGARCTPARWARLDQLARPWQQDVVTPLRDLRRAWRAAAQSDPQLAALRERLKGLELDAERRLLERLDALARTWPSGEDVKACWLGRLPGTAPNLDRKALQVLRLAARQAHAGSEGTEARPPMGAH